MQSTATTQDFILIGDISEPKPQPDFILIDDDSKPDFILIDDDSEPELDTIRQNSANSPPTFVVQVSATCVFKTSDAAQHGSCVPANRTSSPVVNAQTDRQRKKPSQLRWYHSCAPAGLTAALHPELKSTFDGRRYLEQQDRNAANRQLQLFREKHLGKPKSTKRQRTDLTSKSSGIPNADVIAETHPNKKPRNSGTVDSAPAPDNDAAVEEFLALWDENTPITDEDGAVEEFLSIWEALGSD